ncbi:MAG: UDP-N-acetylmuramoyl-L-alanyl-D-glutamate--2,6-diaminopimelate ligase [Bacteroidales bacterium]|nr:UDP-N-acetylmuramoyl-L-alanyl-D-glutamate--2,6-diaminopimelate ligase [Bacteroidales bacterium]
MEWRKMKLYEVISGSGVVSVLGDNELEITGITCDSRAVRDGMLFIAVKGFATDGHGFIQDALNAGAAAVVYEDAAAVEGMTADLETSATLEGSARQTAMARVRSSRRAMAIIASNFYGSPSSKLNLIGITGTNGKTTIATLMHEMFTSMGYCCGLLSTIANYVGARRSETANTTSDPITTNALLAEMVDAGCEYCFMEVSSIGVVQDRTAGLKFKAGVFTNLTHDHLDYHKTFDEYLRCKKLFFDSLPSDAYAIINIDDRNGQVMVQNTKAEVVTYSCRTLADHNAAVIERSFEGMLLRMDGREVWTGLIGRHNAYNILAVYSAAAALGAKTEDILLAISALHPAKGRLETVSTKNDVSVVIDYAHTPDAMENALRTLREIAPERTLVCLFGCGGDRDRTKRPEMGKIAGAMADRIVVTSDNSRTENTSDIMADIRGGMDAAARAKALFIEDRAEAIRTAIMTAQPATTILLAGKGHETYQILGGEKRHFDEREVVAEILADLTDNTERRP